MLHFVLGARVPLDGVRTKGASQWSWNVVCSLLEPKREELPHLSNRNMSVYSLSLDGHWGTFSQTLGKASDRGYLCWGLPGESRHTLSLFWDLLWDVLELKDQLSLDLGWDFFIENLKNIQQNSYLVLQISKCLESSSWTAHMPNSIFSGNFSWASGRIAFIGTRNSPS